MPKPSERIEEYARSIVDELMKRMQDAETDESRKTTELMGKLFGLNINLADIAEQKLKDPMIQIAAIIGYLDEVM